MGIDASGQGMDLTQSFHQALYRPRCNRFEPTPSRNSSNQERFVMAAILRRQNGGQFSCFSNGMSQWQTSFLQKQINGFLWTKWIQTPDQQKAWGQNKENKAKNGTAAIDQIAGHPRNHGTTFLHGQRDSPI